MPFRARRTFRSGNARPRRPMDWGAGFDQTNLGTNIALSDWIWFPTAVKHDHVDPTLMFTQVQWTLRLQAAQAAAGGWIGLGLIVWSSRDDTVPNLPPRPVSDANLDWVYNVIVPIPGSLANGTTITPYQTERFVSSKARRRMGNDQGLLLCLENFSAAPVDVAYAVRFLMKE